MERSPDDGAANHVLGYAHPAPPHRCVARVSADSVFVTAVAFAAGHWVTEYATGYVLHFWFTERYESLAARRPGRAPEGFAWDMCVETALALLEIPLFLVVGFVTRPAESRTARRHAWLIAMLAGGFLSGVRWGLWWWSRLASFNYGEGASFVTAMGLTVASAAFVSGWRRPRAGPAFGHV